MSDRKKQGKNERKMAEEFDFYFFFVANTNAF